MKDLKIKVNNEAESKEVQELLFELGYEWHAHGKTISYLDTIATDDFGYLVAWKTGCFSKHIIQMGCGKEDAKETTIAELRAMVEPKMKEYLMPNRNYEYILTDAREALEPHAKDWISIPEGAEVAFFDDSKLAFAKPINFGSDVLVLEDGIDSEWDTTKWSSWAEFIDYGFNMVWQRPTQPEALPFIDDNPQSLNDQYAEIEKVRQQSIEATLAERQSTYGNFEDVAFVTENIMSILGRVRVNGLSELPTTHRMALYMIASKMARIVNGDFNHFDSWHDIGGYAKLIEDLVKENNNG